MIAGYIVKRAVEPDLQKYINQCPGTHRLHSVVPFSIGQKGAPSYFIIVFEPRDFGNEG